MRSNWGLKTCPNAAALNSYQSGLKTKNNPQEVEHVEEVFTFGLWSRARCWGGAMVTLPGGGCSPVMGSPLSGGMALGEAQHTLPLIDTLSI